MIDYQYFILNIDEFNFFKKKIFVFCRSYKNNTVYLHYVLMTRLLLNSYFYKLLTLNLLS